MAIVWMYSDSITRLTPSSRSRSRPPPARGPSRLVRTATNTMLTAELRNTTFLGIYKRWDLGNPSLGPNPIFTSWSILDNATTRALIDADHMYLGIALDRAAIPTESTRVAGEYIEAIAALIDDGTYAELEFFYYDITGGTITFLNILLGLIQFFDYLLMVPIVVLALTVLVYGLVLSLEQRRREISIQRVIGATQPGLQRTVILEVAVMSVLAYIVGVIVALLLWKPCSHR